MPRLSAGVFLAIFALSAPLQAGEGAAESAEALFRQGRDDLKRGDSAGARMHFERSYRLDPAVGTLLNLAIAEERVGLLTSAWRHARSVVDTLAPVDDRTPIAKELFDRLDAKVPRLRLQLPLHVRDVHAWVDGRKIHSEGFSAFLPIDPGVHTVTVRAAGRKARETRILLREADRLEFMVDVGPLDTSTATSGSAPAGENGSSDALAFWLLGGGGAGLASSVVFGAMVLHEKGIVDDHCNSSHQCDGYGLEAANRGRTYSAVSTVSFLAGALLAGVGGYVLLTAPKGTGGKDGKAVWKPPLGLSF